jgi:hypothetical protein
MEFEHYAAARDLLYLSALFAGAGLGCILSGFRINSTLRFRSRAITLAFCLFSGLVVALAGALVYSNGLVVFEKSLYIPMAIAMGLMVLAVRFPRAAGFPLILVSGLVVIWIGYSYLRFPQLDTGEFFLASITNEGKGLYAVRIAAAKGPASSVGGSSRMIAGGGSPPEQNLSIQTAGGDDAPEFFFTRISFAPSYPLIGGGCRGIITEIRDKKEVFYSDPRLSRGLLRGWYTRVLKLLTPESGNWRVIFEESHEEIPAALFPGRALEVSFDGNSLLFVPKGFNTPPSNP